MPSQVDIANLALRRLGANSIVSLTEDSKPAREMNRIFNHCRDSELRAHPWSFAKKRVSLAADSTAPAHGYTTRYALPSDYMRLLPTNEQTDLVIENGYILTNNYGSTEALPVTYVASITDPNEWDQTFIDLMVARLAMDACEALTDSNTKFERMGVRYTVAQREARRVNGIEGPPDEPPEDSWITVRN